jgi:hypothetical protein
MSRLAGAGVQMRPRFLDRNAVAIHAPTIGHGDDRISVEAVGIAPGPKTQHCAEQIFIEATRSSGAPFEKIASKSLKASRHSTALKISGTAFAPLRPVVEVAFISHEEDRQCVRQVQ